MSKHTKTPWRLDGGIILGTSANGKERPIADIYRELKSSEETLANAAFIVRAVNAHDQLVAALREIESLHVPDQPTTSDCDERVWVLRHVAKLRGIANQTLRNLEDGP